MFVYRMITPYFTKFHRLTNRKFMEIVGTRGRSDFNGKMHQNRFRLGLRPRPRWGSLRRSPRPPSQMRRGIPLSHTLPPSAPMALVSAAPRPSFFTPSAFGCLTEAKTHPTSSFWCRHWTQSDNPLGLLLLGLWSSNRVSNVQAMPCCSSFLA